MNTYHKIHGLYKRYLEGEKKGKFIIEEYSKPEFKLLKDIQWIWTEKVDGTNIRIIWDGEGIERPMNLIFKGKTDKAELSKHLVTKLHDIFCINDFLATATGLPTLSRLPPRDTPPTFGCSTSTGSC